MYEYIEGKSMWAKVTTPNANFGDPKYEITVLTDQETADRLEGIGLSQVKDKFGNPKFEEPAFAFRRKVEVAGRVNSAPKLVDTDGNPMDVSVGNGSEVKVKFKPYSSKFGTFGELIAVKVNKLVEYSEPDADNEEF
jgi:hypothetical protein